ncbi:MAG: metallopeptidase family protein [Elusimicrobia bacterium]|nr:metallopeptidase family protein [Elusimicrobiota bacterium]
MDNVVIVAQPRPTPAQARRHARSLLGLYEGVPLSKRGASYSGVMPDKITIFYRNIADYCKTTGADQVNTVAHTVRHEIAHHFGIDDARLRATGNY